MGDPSGRPLCGVGVALVDKHDLDTLLGHGLDRMGQLRHLVAVLRVGWCRMQRQQLFTAA